MKQITLDMVKAAYEAVGGGIEGTLIQKAIYKGAFDLVANKNDWRAPINTWLPEGEAGYGADVIAASVEFFVGTTCVCKRESSGYRFQAVGYRAGSCGP